MLDKKMVLIMFVCMVGLVTARAGFAFAAEGSDLVRPEAENGAMSRFSLQLDGVYMDVKGLDPQNVVVWTSTVSSLTSGSLVSYAASSVGNTQDFDLDAQLTLRPEFMYRISDLWKVGASGWWFDDKASIGGELPASTGDTFYMVEMWDAPVFSGDYVNYRAGSDFSIWTADVFATRNIVNGRRGFVDITAGAKIGVPDHKEERWVRTSGSGDSMGGDTTILTGEFSSTQEADYSFLGGPSFGARSKIKIYGPVSIEGLFSQSVIFGNVDQEGHATHLIIFDEYSGGVLTSSTRFLDEGAFSRSKSVVIPATEIKAKFIYDITKNVSVDAGGFFSLWVDMPTAPEYNAYQGTWQETERTLRAVGALFGVTVRY